MNNYGNYEEMMWRRKTLEEVSENESFEEMVRLELLDTSQLAERVKNMEEISETISTPGWEIIRKFIEEQMSIGVFLTAPKENLVEIVGRMKAFRDLLSFIDTILKQGKQAREKLVKIRTGNNK